MTATQRRPRQAFDYTAHLERLIEHVIGACPAFAHVDPARILVGWSQSKVGGDHGVYATIQGLRFAGGASTTQRGRIVHRWPRVEFDGREILYVIYFMLPRFADMPLRGKLTTVFHELYHVSPACNGDIRRFPGRNYAHGHSRDAYNARLQPWIDAYLRLPESAETTAFLNMSFSELLQQHGQISGRRLRVLRPLRGISPPG